MRSSPIFADCLLIFSPKIVCNFYLQSSDIRDTGEVFPSAWGGGGGLSSPRFFFLEITDSNDAF